MTMGVRGGVGIFSSPTERTWPSRPAAWPRITMKARNVLPAPTNFFNAEELTKNENIWRIDTNRTRRNHRKE
jgi:hypothetical protein